MLRRPSTKGRWAPALRSGLSLAVASSILLACGFGQESLLAALGAFAALYGERRPYLLRWKVVLTAGVLLLAAATGFGALGSGIGPDPSTPAMLGVVLALAACAAASVFVANALRLGPPGPYFFLLVAGVSQLVAQHGVDIAHLALFVATGVIVALVMSMAPALWRPHGPEHAATAAALNAAEQYLSRNEEAEPAERHGVALSTLNAWSVLHDAAATDGDLAQRLWSAHLKVNSTEPDGDGGDGFVAPLPRPRIVHRLRFAARRNSHAAVSAFRATVAAVVAGVIAVSAGLGRPDWAILSAVLVLQMGPDRVHGAVRGAHRVIGTVLGVGLFAALHALDLHISILIIVLTILNMLIELTVSTNYAVAVIFITPLALLIGGPSTPLADQVRDRLIETVIGVGIALLTMWFLLPRAHRRTLRGADGIALRAGRHVLDDGASAPVDGPPMRANRRDLQWHLLEAELAASDSASDDPAWAHAYWPEHGRVRDLGYDVLGACWRTPPGKPLSEDILRRLNDRFD
ncbi:MAG: FUSC family protein [Gordonia sp. (in: high G+C Gram-positive bacteria)]